MLLYFLYTIHVLTCIFLILVVLLQRGKGADLSVFGGGSTQAAFGARGTATLLHKLTVGFFVGFIITTLSIAMVQSRSQGTTVLAGADDEAAEESVVTEGEAEGADGAALPDGTTPTDGAAAPGGTDGLAPATSPEAGEATLAAPADATQGGTEGGEESP